MFSLDLYTFLVLVETLIVIYAISAFFVYLVRRHPMHLAMALSLLTMVAVFAVMIVSLDQPTVITVLLYNFLYLVSSMLITVSFRQYFKLEIMPLRYWVYLGSSILGFYFFSVTVPSYIGRVSLNTFYMVLFIVDAITEARQEIRTERQTVKRVIYTAIGLLLFFFIARYIYVLFFSDHESSFRQNMISTAYMTGTFAVLTFNFWLTGSMLLDSDRTVRGLQAKTKAMTDLALIDPLTHLLNRRKMEEDFSELVENSDREGGIASVLLIDLDYFKQINDLYGHDAGDQILTLAAKTISSLLRSDDRVYRWGGDEFLILTPHTDLVGARRLAQRLLEQFGGMVFPAVNKVTLSIGCAQHFRYETKTDLFKRVDLALYKAKQSGRNRYEVWSNEEMLAASITKLVWSEAFVSGHDEIDRQHRNLIRLSNELYDALGSSDSGANLEEILNRVASDLIEHFAYEANLMDETGFFEAKDHRKTHDRLLAEFASMRDELHLGRVNLGAFFNFVSVRIVAEHIIKEDTKFFAHLKTRKP